MTTAQLEKGIDINNRINELKELRNSELVHIGTVVEGDRNDEDTFTSEVLEQLTTEMKGVTRNDVLKNNLLLSIRTELRLKFRETISAEIAKLLEELKAI